MTSEEDAVSSGDVVLDPIRGHYMSMLNPWLEEPVNPDTFRELLRALKKVGKYKRQKKLEKVAAVLEFLEFSVFTKDGGEENLFELKSLFMEIVIHVHQMLFRLMEEGQSVMTLCNTLNRTIVEFLQALLVAKGPDEFLNSTEKLYRFYFDFIKANPASWFYVLAAAGPMEIIVSAYDEASDREKFSALMKANIVHLANSVSSCGDYQCQHCLLILIIVWLQSVPEETQNEVMRSCFTQLPDNMKKMLTKKHDPDYKTRFFLKFLNDQMGRTKSGRVITSIMCLHAFVGETQILTADHELIPEFWITFSSVSRRLHCFCSFPPTHPWVTLNIQQEDVDSACFYWSRNETTENEDWINTQKSSLLTRVLPTTQRMTLRESHLVAVVHIQLKQDFQHHCALPDVGLGQKSLFIVFNDPKVAEEALALLQIDRHQFDRELCQLPSECTKLLKERNITFTQIFDHECQQLMEVSEDEDYSGSHEDALAKLLGTTRPTQSDDPLGAPVKTFGRNTPVPPTTPGPGVMSPEFEEDAFLTEPRTPTPNPRVYRKTPTHEAQSGLSTEPRKKRYRKTPVRLGSDSDESLEALPTKTYRKTPVRLDSEDEAGSWKQIPKTPLRPPTDMSQSEGPHSAKKYRKTPIVLGSEESSHRPTRQYRVTPRLEPQKKAESQFLSESTSETEEERFGKRYRKTPSRGLDLEEAEAVAVNKGFRKTPMPEEKASVCSKKAPGTPGIGLEPENSSAEDVGRSAEDWLSSQELFPRIPSPEDEADSRTKSVQEIPPASDSVRVQEFYSEELFPPPPRTKDAPQISFRTLFGDKRAATPRPKAGANQDEDNFSMCPSFGTSPGYFRHMDITDSDSSPVTKAKDFPNPGIQESTTSSDLSLPSVVPVPVSPFSAQGQSEDESPVLARDPSAVVPETPAQCFEVGSEDSSQTEFGRAMPGVEGTAEDISSIESQEPVIESRKSPSTGVTERNELLGSLPTSAGSRSLSLGSAQCVRDVSDFQLMESHQSPVSAKVSQAKELVGSLLAGPDPHSHSPLENSEDSDLGFPDLGAQTSTQTPSALPAPTPRPAPVFIDSDEDIQIYSEEEDVPPTPARPTKAKARSKSTKKFSDEVYDNCDKQRTAQSASLLRKSSSSNGSSEIKPRIRYKQSTTRASKSKPPLYRVTQNILPMIRKVLVAKVPDRVPCYNKPIEPSPPCEDPYNFAVVLKADAAREQPLKKRGRKKTSKPSEGGKRVEAVKPKSPKPSPVPKRARKIPVPQPVSAKTKKPRALFQSSSSEDEILPGTKSVGLSGRRVGSCRATPVLPPSVVLPMSDGEEVLLLSPIPSTPKSRMAPVQSCSTTTSTGTRTKARAKTTKPPVRVPTKPKTTPILRRRSKEVVRKERNITKPAPKRIQKSGKALDNSPPVSVKDHGPSLPTVPAKPGRGRPRKQVKEDEGRKAQDKLGVSETHPPTPSPQQRSKPQKSLSPAPSKKKLKGRNARDDLSSVWQDLEPLSSEPEDEPRKRSSERSEVRELDCRGGRSSRPLQRRRTERGFRDDLSSVWQGISSPEELERGEAEELPIRAMTPVERVEEWRSQMSNPAHSPNDDSFDWDNL